MSTLQTIEVVGRGSETQLQVGENKPFRFTSTCFNYSHIDFYTSIACVMHGLIRMNIIVSWLYTLSF